MGATRVTVVSKSPDFMSEAMGKTAARNIAARLRGAQEVERPFRTLRIHYLLDGGDGGLMLLADDVLPPRRFQVALGGRWVLWLKLGSERYHMTKMKLGLSRLP